MSPKDADGMANSVDPDQIAPVGAQTFPLGSVWSGSTLFAQTYLSKNLGLGYGKGLYCPTVLKVLNSLLLTAWQQQLPKFPSLWGYRNVPKF